MKRLLLFVSIALPTLLIGGGATPAWPAQAVDPFYADLLRSGTQALERGETARAVAELRLACFGMLEQPADLALCLVRLSLAQARQGEREEFLTTFRRIEEVETRFGAYGSAALDAAERAAFETQAAAWVAPEVLKSLPGFASVVRERELAAVRALPANRRLPELQKRIEAEPGELAWKLMAAELELADERPIPAAGYLAGADPAAEGGRVACLRGRALALSARCADAVADLARCPERGATAELLDPDLACLVELELWSEARALLAGASPRVRDRSAVRRLERKIPEEPEAAPPPPVEASEEPAAEPPPAEESEPSAPAPEPESASTSPAPLSAEESAAIAEARQRLRSARTSADLDAALALLQPISAAHPELANLELLTGEIHYRASRWGPCSEAYRRAGESGPEDPTQRFYMAVCLYESGDRAGAAALAATGLERLPRTAFVESYLDRFAGAD